VCASPDYLASRSRPRIAAAPHLVYLGGGLLPLKVRAFLDFAAPRLKPRLAGDLA
jgi:hypothetical protein